jgi:predicted DNA-binding transcriptional regulator
MAMVTQNDVGNSLLKFLKQKVVQRGLVMDQWVGRILVEGLDHFA